MATRFNLISGCHAPLSLFSMQAMQVPSRSNDGNNVWSSILCHTHFGERATHHRLTRGVTQISNCPLQEPTTVQASHCIAPTPRSHISARPSHGSRNH